MQITVDEINRIASGLSNLNFPIFVGVMGEVLNMSK